MAASRHGLISILLVLAFWSLFIGCSVDIDRKNGIAATEIQSPAIISRGISASSAPKVPFLRHLWTIDTQTRQQYPGYRLWRVRFRRQVFLRDGVLKPLSIPKDSVPGLHVDMYYMLTGRYIPDHAKRIVVRQSISVKSKGVLPWSQVRPEPRRLSSEELSLEKVRSTFSLQGLKQMELQTALSDLIKSTQKLNPSMSLKGEVWLTGEIYSPHAPHRPPVTDIDSRPAIYRFNFQNGQVGEVYPFSSTLSSTRIEWNKAPPREEHGHPSANGNPFQGWGPAANRPPPTSNNVPSRDGHSHPSANGNPFLDGAPAVNRPPTSSNANPFAEDDPFTR